MKAIIQAKTREILDLYNKEEISYSRMNEMFNELADEWAIQFAEWLMDGHVSKLTLKEFKNR
jgi:hypothetical protein